MFVHDISSISVFVHDISKIANRKFTLVWVFVGPLGRARILPYRLCRERREYFFFYVCVCVCHKANFAFVTNTRYNNPQGAFISLSPTLLRARANYAFKVSTRPNTTAYVSAFDKVRREYTEKVCQVEMATSKNKRVHGGL